MEKKAQSQIITTVLIILLVLAAIVIVWQVVNSTIREGAEGIEGGMDCSTIGLEIQPVAAGASSIVVKRLAGEGDLKKIRVIVAGEVKDEDTDAQDLAELGQITIALDSSLSGGEKIEVATIVGENNKLCDVSDTYTVPSS